MERVETEKGILIIPMNYTGDVLNFGMAASKAKAAGLQAEFFAIADDVGVGRKQGGKVGRRGIGGGILVLKIVGALAETGYVLCFSSILSWGLSRMRGANCFVERLWRMYIGPLNSLLRILYPLVLLLTTPMSPEETFPTSPIKSQMARSRLEWVFTMSQARTA